MGDAASIYWVEARDTSKHTAVHGQPATAKNYSGQNVNSVEVEKVHVSPCKK